MGIVLPVTIQDGVTDMNAASVMDNFDYLQAKWPLELEVSFFIPGPLVIETQVVRNYVFGRKVELYSIYAQVKTPSTGADIIIEINKDTTPLAQTITIAEGGYSTQQSFAADVERNYTAAQYLRVDINQVGSAYSEGENLNLIVRFRVHGTNDT
jgi:hypothetical protein